MKKIYLIIALFVANIKGQENYYKFVKPGLAFAAAAGILKLSTLEQVKQIPYSSVIGQIIASGCIAYGVYNLINQNIEFNDKVGFYEMQGKRPTMEDAHCIKIANDHSFFGIFDGHGGRKVADDVASNLYNNLVTNPNFLTNNQIALFESYIKTHTDLEDDISECQGCTAVTALIHDKLIYVANTGDSRAVLSYNGNAIALSDDHKPTRENERQRILNKGGTITVNGKYIEVNYLFFKSRLAITRSIGDKIFSKAGVIPDPEIKLTSLQGSEFLILACDGVWDVLSNQQAVDLVKKSLKNSNNNFNFAAKALVQAAYNKGSLDNISAIVINLKK